MSVLSTLCLTLCPAELLELARDSAASIARKCQCCGSTTSLKRYVLHDLRLWTGCTACAEHCKHCQAHLKGALEVPES